MRTSKRRWENFCRRDRLRRFFVGDRLCRVHPTFGHRSFLFASIFHRFVYFHRFGYARRFFIFSARGSVRRPTPPFSSLHQAPGVA